MSTYLKNEVTKKEKDESYGVLEEAKKSLYFPAQEKFHTVV